MEKEEVIVDLEVEYVDLLLDRVSVKVSGTTKKALYWRRS